MVRFHGLGVGSPKPFSSRIRNLAQYQILTPYMAQFALLGCQKETHVFEKSPSSEDLLPTSRPGPQKYVE